MCNNAEGTIEVKQKPALSIHVFNTPTPLFYVYSPIPLVCMHCPSLPLVLLLVVVPLSSGTTQTTTFGVTAPAHRPVEMKRGVNKGRG